MAVAIDLDLCDKNPVPDGCKQNAQNVGPVGGESSPMCHLLRYTDGSDAGGCAPPPLNT